MTACASNAKREWMPVSTPCPAGHCNVKAVQCCALEALIPSLRAGAKFCGNCGNKREERRAFEQYVPAEADQGVKRAVQHAECVVRSSVPVMI